MNWKYRMPHAWSVATLAIVSSFVLVNAPAAADGAPRKRNPQRLVLSCTFVKADADFRFSALFAENEKGRLTWDVAIDPESKSVSIVGMVQAQVQWELAAAQREELDAVLEKIRVPRVVGVLFLAEGIWGDEDPSSRVREPKRKLSITSIRLSELGGMPATLRYQQVSAEDLRELTDRQLIKAYERIGTKLFGTPYEPGAFPPCATFPGLYPGGYTDAKFNDFEALRREIVRRGDALVPRLMRFLREEVTRQRERAISPGDEEFLGRARGFYPSPAGLLRDLPGTPGTGGPSFTTDLVHLLATIGNPKPAPLFLQIAEGFDGKASPSHRVAALAGLQRLTYISLRPIGPYDGDRQVLLEHPLAAEIEYSQDRLDRQLGFFREWLADEGKNRADWLPLARRQARTMLESDDPAKVYQAAQFLQPLGHDPLRGGFYESGHDDQPERTLDRIAEVMSGFGTSDVYFVSGRNPGYRIPGDRGHWVQLLASYRARARKHAALIIDYRLHDQPLLEVGGDEILQYIVECLDHAAASEPLKRVIFDRWAGRAFQNDTDRKAWWQANREKSDEERLRDSLPKLVAQSDERNAFANQIVQTVLPDAPPYYEQDKGGKFVPGPSRVQWLREHAELLHYDAVRGEFRLTAK